MAKYLTIESIKSCLQRAKTYFDDKLKLKANNTDLQSTNANVSSLTTQLSTANSKITANEKTIATNTTNITKVRSWASETFVKNHSRQSTVDFNTLFDAGFYRLQNKNSNGPTIDHNFGNAVVVRGLNSEDTLAQIVFSYTNYSNCFSIRWGSTTESSVDNIANHPWYYFHGSKSPNIPVLKKLFISGETTINGNLSLHLDHATNIVLSITGSWPGGDSGVVVTPYRSENSWAAHIKKEIADFGEIKNMKVELIVHYLNIPSDYTIPEDATATSDEPEDDEELAPQSYTTYEKPSETKQFHGESLYE